jgi:hypothetical protein
MFAALMVDIGSWYKQSQDLQRTADAAALAGATYLPGTPGVTNQSGLGAMVTCGANPDTAMPKNAYCAALKVVLKNGYDGTGLSTQPDPGNSNQFDVTLVQSNVQTYFASVVMGPLTFTRQSHALFSQPIPLGSPQNYFGTGDLAGFPGANGNTTSGFWAAIDGTCSPTEQGDQYASAYDGGFDLNPPGGGAPNLWYLPPGKCGDNSNPGFGANPNGWDAKGYVYDINVPAGQTSTLWLYDPYFNPCYQQTAGTLKRMDTDLNFALYNTSVAGCETGKGQITAGPGNAGFHNQAETTFNTYFTLVDPLNSTSQTFTYPTKKSNFAAGWVKVVDLPSSGTWQLNVATLASGTVTPDTNSYGQNSFAIFASKGTSGVTPGTGTDLACNTITDPACPQVFADQGSGLSVKMISGAATTDDIYLAQVPSFAVGKTVDVTLWDPGDLASYIQILDSNGTPVPSFKYAVTKSNNVPASGATTVTTCTDPVVGGYSPPPHPFVGASPNYACLPVDQCIQGTSIASGLGNCLDNGGNWLSGAPNNRYGPAVYSDAQVDLYFNVTPGMLGANGNWFTLREVVPTGQSVNDRLTMSLHVLGLPPHLTP